MLRRLRARQEWQFFAVLPKADPVLATVWWALLILNGAMPAVFAVAIGTTVNAVQQATPVGGPLAVTGLVFSYMQGIFHPYYAVALAPAVGALVGMGATGLWEVRRHPLMRWWLAGTLAVTAVWSYLLLRRTPDWHPGLAPLVLVVGLVVAGLVATIPQVAPRRAVLAVATAGLLVGLAGPAAYSLDTAATPPQSSGRAKRSTMRIAKPPMINAQPTTTALPSSSSM